MTATGRNAITSISENTSLTVAKASPYLGVLQGVMHDLGVLNKPAEEAFLAIGSVLGEASGLLGTVQTHFSSLVERLEESAAKTTATSLLKAIEQIASLAGENHGSTAALTRLGDEVKRIEARLLALSKVVGEVGALAINAKIQASLIVSGGIDFTVFTAEIQRLGDLADHAIADTLVRLRTLNQSILNAISGEQDFERGAAKELASVQGRLAEGLEILANQQRAAVKAVEQVGLLSSDTVRRVAACIVELQFNDTACQRVEHVRDAMAIVIELAVSGSEEKIDSLVGAICRLQALQLAQTATEYGAKVDVLIGNLREIANDALDIVLDADSAISSQDQPQNGSRQVSFLSALEKDIALAARLLTGQVVERDRVKNIVQSVSAGFAAMATDLDTIHSIDSDMRVMGLNATFKCARLGIQGRALGVIAFELRSCSKRTEELSEQVSEMVQGVIALSKSLGTQERNDADVVSELGHALTESLGDLGAVSAALDDALKELHRDGDRVASLLSGTADKIQVHHHMSAALTLAASKLNSVADMTGIDVADIAAMGDRIRALLSDRYTMQSERLIHKVFADCFDTSQFHSVSDAPRAAASIDDLLF
jgi:hypothetical protein